MSFRPGDRGAKSAGRIILAPAGDEVLMTFEGMASPPAARSVPSMDAARSFAVALHQVHGWAIVETYDDGDGAE